MFRSDRCRQSGSGICNGQNVGSRNLIFEIFCIQAPKPAQPDDSDIDFCLHRFSYSRYSGFNDSTTLELPILYRWRSEEHTSELQSRGQLVCRLLLEKKKL